MSKQNKIDAIRRGVLQDQLLNDEAKLKEYFDSLDQSKNEFLDYILAAGLSIEGILKPIERLNYIQICNELIERIYEPGTYYGIIPKHIHTESARRVIIGKARIRNKDIVKIFHEKNKDIEIVIF